MSLHRPNKSTCSCHPDSMIDKIVAAIDAETTSIVMAFFIGFFMGGCSYYAAKHVKFEHHRLGLEKPIQVPSCAESQNCALTTLGGTAVDVVHEKYCDQTMFVLASGEVVPDNCHDRAVALGVIK